MKKLKTILKGIRVPNGKTYIWVLDRATDRMVRVDYIKLGIDFFSKKNAN